MNSQTSQPIPLQESLQTLLKIDPKMPLMRAYLFVYVGSCGEAITPSELSVKIGIPRPSVYRHLEILSKKGFRGKGYDLFELKEGDQENTIHLTLKGKRVYDHVCNTNERRHLSS